MDPARILCVSLDVSKYFHLVMIHNAYGEIGTPAFEIDIFRTGFERLCAAIEAAKTQTQAKLILIALEPTGHYFENLARHLKARYPHVFLTNSWAVAENRDQKLMHYEKTDQTDVAAIGDLLRRGEGTPYQPVQDVYLTMQHLDRVRLAKVKMANALKNQILGHLDRIFPGLVIQGEAAQQRYRPRFTSDFWTCDTAQQLIRVCPDPRRLAQMTPKELVTAFHRRGYRPPAHPGALPPPPESPHAAPRRGPRGHGPQGTGHPLRHPARPAHPGPGREGRPGGSSHVNRLGFTRLRQISPGVGCATGRWRPAYSRQTSQG